MEYGENLFADHESSNVFCDGKKMLSQLDICLILGFCVCRNWLIKTILLGLQRIRGLFSGCWRKKCLKPLHSKDKKVIYSDTVLVVGIEVLCPLLQHQQNNIKEIGNCKN